MENKTKFEILKEHCAQQKMKHIVCWECKHASLCEEISRLLGLDIYDIRKERTDEKEKV